MKLMYAVKILFKNLLLITAIKYDLVDINIPGRISYDCINASGDITHEVYIRIRNIYDMYEYRLHRYVHNKK